MYIRLDSTHRLVLDRRTHSWVIYKCVRIAPYSKKKHKEKLKNHKSVIVLENVQGDRAFGIWKRGKSFGNNGVGDALMEWIYSILGEKYKGKELIGIEALEAFDLIKERISDIIMATNVLDVKITFDSIPKKDIERMVKEHTAIRNEAVKKLKRRIRRVGPKTVFAPTVIDKGDGEYYRHVIELDGKGSIRVVKKKYQRPAKPGHGSRHDGRTEYVVTDKSLAPKKRGNYIFRDADDSKIKTKGPIKTKAERCAAKKHEEEKEKDAKESKGSLLSGVLKKTKKKPKKSRLLSRN